uniref:Uncharacterized protein n=1 Tax=Rhabditophanes sp. KR3021 TaxID=114890 RepID=A0AC35TXI5_9BILA
MSDNEQSSTNNNNTTTQSNSAVQRSSSGNSQMLSLPSFFTNNKTKSTNDVRQDTFTSIQSFSSLQPNDKNRLSPTGSIKNQSKYSSSSTDISRVEGDVILRSNGGSGGSNTPTYSSSANVNYLNVP